MTNNSPLYILGAGGHAASVLDAAQSAGWTVVGFIDPHTKGELWGVPILPNMEGLDLSGAALALGIGTNFSRESVFAEIRSQHPGAQFPPIVHSRAWVSPLASLAEASVVLSMASVGPGARLETGALVNTRGSLDHDSVLANWASLGPGATTGGKVSVGARTMVGLGAGILHGVTVGADAVIGAHALVSTDIADAVVAVGVPAKIVKSRLRDDPYF